MVVSRRGTLIDSYRKGSPVAKAFILRSGTNIIVLYTCIAYLLYCIGIG
jgi:hypothetical protein